MNQKFYSIFCLVLLFGAFQSTVFGQTLLQQTDKIVTEDYAQGYNNQAFPSNLTALLNKGAVGTCDFNLQFVWNLADTLGATSLAGITFTGTDFWVSRWNTGDFWRVSASGNFLEQFTIPGVTGARSITWDGTHIYVGAAGTTVYKVNPATKTLVSSFPVPVAARHLTYDPTANGGNGGFWLGTWATDIVLVSKTGATLASIPAATHGLTGMYGSAYDGVSAGGPYLWMFDQGTDPSQSTLVQLQLPSGQPTGFTKNVGAEIGNGLAGGAFIASNVVAGTVTIGGIRQTGLAFGYELNFTPSTCQSPSDLDTTSVTGTTANLAWTAGTGTFAELEWGEAGFTQGTGNLVSNLTGTTYALTGLQAGKSYHVYVRDNCGGSDPSCWTSPLLFTTPCPPSVQAPYTENFYVFALPACWNSYSTSGETWLFNTGAAYAAGNAGDHTGNGGGYAWVDGSVFNGAGSTGVTLETPFVNLTNVANPELVFWLFSVNNDIPGNYNTLKVDASANGTTWTNVFTHQADNGGWTKHIVDLSGIATPTNQIKVRFVVDENAAISPWFNDILIDDVTIRDQPACTSIKSFDFSNVQATSTNLNWVTLSGATTWNIEYGTKGFSLGSGTTTTATSNPFNLTGLTAGTCYDVYIQDNCGTTNGLSDWEGPFTFCTAYPTPYHEPFGSVLPNGWKNYSTNFEKWLFTKNIAPIDGLGHGPAADKTNGNGYFAWVDDSENFNLVTSDVTLETPFIDVSGLTYPVLSFQLWSNNEGGNANSTVSVDIWDGSTWHNNVFTQTDNTTSLNWEEIVIHLSQFTLTGPVKARFIVDEATNTPSFYDDIAIDDVRVREGYQYDARVLFVDYLGEYTQVPYYQAASPTQPSAVIQNIGKNNLTGVTAQMRVFSPSGATVFNETVSIGALNANAKATVIPTGSFTPSELGTYNLQIDVNATQNDGNPANNSVSEARFEVTPQTFARDNDQMVRSLGFSVGNSGYLAQSFTLNTDDEVVGVKLVITQGDSSIAGQELIVDILGMVNGEPDAGSVFGSSAPFVLSDVSEPTEIEVLFNNPVALTAGEYAFAVIDAPNGQWFLCLSDFISTDSKSFYTPDFVTWTALENDASTGAFAIRPVFSRCGATPFSLAFNVTGTSTNGASDGTIDLTVNGGTPPFTYSWSTGATTQDVSSLAQNIYGVTVTDALGCEQTGAPAVYLVHTTSIKGLNKLALFPNPATTNAILDLEFEQPVELSIQIFNALGQQVAQQQHSRFTNGRLTFDTTDLSQGTYWLQIQANGEVHTEKLVVLNKKD